MVDAQAPGLAARVRELGAIPGSRARLAGRGCWRSARCSICSTRAGCAASGCRTALAATVRSRVGLPGSARTGPPVRDRWLVLAQYDTADGRLTTRRIWLHGDGVRPHGAAPLLRGRRPRARAGASGRAGLRGGGVRVPGRRSAAGGPGRAVHGARARAPYGRRGITPSEAAARYGAALRDDPWLDSCPVTLARVIPTPDGDSWQLADADGDLALPLTPSAPLPPRPVAPGRPLRRRPRHGLRRVRPPRLHPADGLGRSEPGERGAAVLTDAVPRTAPAGRRHGPAARRRDGHRTEGTLMTDRASAGDLGGARLGGARHRPRCSGPSGVRRRAGAGPGGARGAAGRGGRGDRAAAGRGCGRRGRRRGRSRRRRTRGRRCRPRRRGGWRCCWPTGPARAAAAAAGHGARPHGAAAPVAGRWRTPTATRRPREALPALLDAARGRTDLRPAALAFAGPRALWLARLNPDWRFALRAAPGGGAALPGPDEPERVRRLWQEGLFAERVALLTAIRAQRPGGRAASCWRRPGRRSGPRTG